MTLTSLARVALASAHFFTGASSAVALDPTRLHDTGILLAQSDSMGTEHAHDGAMVMDHHGATAVAAGDLLISGAFSRATLPGAPVAGGFMSIQNLGTEDDALIGAETPFAGMTQLHQMRMDGDVMKMSEVEGGIALPAGETVILAPGDLHVMFMQLREPFEEGALVPVLLTFEKAGPVEILLRVGTFNALSPEPGYDGEESVDMHNMDHEHTDG
jgi:hypothetical protein